MAREIIAVLEGNSKALAKKMELHRFAMVNRYVSTPVHPLSVLDTLLGVMYLALDLLTSVDGLGRPPSQIWALYHTLQWFSSSFNGIDTQSIMIYSK